MEEVILSFDIDWAPDWMILDVAETLIEKKVKSTWFVTHDTPALGLLREHADLIELGWHPNFLAGSSHGDTEREVLDCLKSLVPEAVGVRTHSLYQSERLQQVMVEEYGIKYDSSVYLRACAGIKPFRVKFRAEGDALVRVPHFYQDNMDMNTGRGFRLDSLGVELPGLKVFDFHPIHIAMNSKSNECYERLKAEVGLEGATREAVALYRETGEGVSDLFKRVVDGLAESGSSRTLSDYVDKWISKGRADG